MSGNEPEGKEWRPRPEQKWARRRGHAVWAWGAEDRGGGVDRGWWGKPVPRSSVVAQSSTPPQIGETQVERGLVTRGGLVPGEARGTRPSQSETSEMGGLAGGKAGTMSIQSVNHVEGGWCQVGGGNPEIPSQSGTIVTAKPSVGLVQWLSGDIRVVRGKRWVGIMWAGGATSRGELIRKLSHVAVVRWWLGHRSSRGSWLAQ
ncbi:hypothetical protein EDB86DRAFT_3151621 [Lactarius hatsudake]|nr:hypothetical protein EDB86DRAFT_3151621 [Lactarius hatsudake]